MGRSRGQAATAGCLPEESWVAGKGSVHLCISFSAQVAIVKVRVDPIGKEVTMERRWSRRLPIQWSALITDRNHQPVLAQVENVGLEGMFLHIRNPWVRLEGLLEVKILIPQTPRGIKIFNISGYVVHETTRGVGVMLVHFNRSLYQYIELLLNAADSYPGEGVSLDGVGGQADSLRLGAFPAGTGSKWAQAPIMISHLPPWEDPDGVLPLLPTERPHPLHRGL